MTIEELRAALEALPRYEFTSGVGSHAQRSKDLRVPATANEESGDA